MAVHLQGDICEPDFMRYIFREEKIDVVMHFAAQSHVGKLSTYGCTILFSFLLIILILLLIHIITKYESCKRSGLYSAVIFLQFL